MTINGYMPYLLKCGYNDLNSDINTSSSNPDKETKASANTFGFDDTLNDTGVIPFLFCLHFATWLETSSKTSL